MTTQVSQNLIQQPYRKNAFINGDFRVWQRGTTDSQTASDQVVKSADRFFYYGLGAARVDLKQSTDAPALADSGRFNRHSLQVDCTTADATVTGDEGGIYYNMEGFDYAQLVGDEVTISFWVKSPKAGTHCFSLRNSNSTRSYVTEYTVASANFWEKIVITVPLNDTGGGGWDYGNGKGLLCYWFLYGDNANTATTDQWIAGNFICTTNQVNVLDNVANNFYLAQVQIERGPVATPFEQRLYTDELAMCRRYFQFSPRTYGHCHTTTSIWQYWKFDTPMRAAPAALVLNSTTPAGESMPFITTITGSGSALGGTHIEFDGCDFIVNGFTGLTVKDQAILRPGYIEAEAEL